MFWKLENNGEYEYHAIVSLKINKAIQEKSLYGQRHYTVTLANRQSFEYTFEQKEWSKLDESYSQGGFILNEYGG